MSWPEHRAQEGREEGGRARERKGEVEEVPS